MRPGSGVKGKNNGRLGGQCLGHAVPEVRLWGEMRDLEDGMPSRFTVRRPGHLKARWFTGTRFAVREEALLLMKAASLEMKNRISNSRSLVF